MGAWGNILLFIIYISYQESKHDLIQNYLIIYLYFLSRDLIRLFKSSALLQLGVFSLHDR